MMAPRRPPPREERGELLDGAAPRSAPPPHHSSPNDAARRNTTALVAVARVMERVDEALLPAVYLYVSCALRASPAALGSITAARSLSQALTSPLGGVLGHYYNRCHVIAAACALWAVCTALFAFSTSITQAALLWAVNGAGLAAMIPNGQSLVADYYPPERRGAAFGCLLAVGNLGTMLGTLYATNLGGASVLGLPGWRFAFLTIAVYSACVGAATAVWGRDPRGDGCRCDRGGGGNGGAAAADAAIVDAGVPRESARELWGEVAGVLRTPTFIIIVVQGIFGSMPWSGMAFATLFFQLQGWSNAAASAVQAALAGAGAAGALLGGVLGDAAAVRFPDHGRIAVCQFSVAVGVPLSLLVWRGLPLGGPGLRAYALYAGTLGTAGLLISWAATAANNPIFAEIVPARSRTLVYAFDRSLEGALSALGAPLVGVVAERVFGFGGGGGEGGGGGAAAGACTPDGGVAASATSAVEPDLGRARALGQAMALLSAVPWALCAAVYSFLHCTYPRDRRRAAAANNAAAARVAGAGVAFAPLATSAAADDGERLELEMGSRRHRSDGGG